MPPQLRRGTLGGPGLASSRAPPTGAASAAAAPFAATAAAALAAAAPFATRRLLRAAKAATRRQAGGAEKSGRARGPRRNRRRQVGPAVVKGATAETVEEAIYRLDNEINDALEADDLRAAAKAQRELRKVQLDRPSAACRLHIQEDCRSATAMLRLGDAIDVDVRVKAARKLGRWLRWRRTAAKGLVPEATALEGLLWALRSEPEVAWTAQCALYYAARVADRAGTSVRDGNRGTLSRMLLNEPNSFCFCLPQLNARSRDSYGRALRSNVVRDFFSQLRTVTLVDPGYGDYGAGVELAPFVRLCRQLGRSFESLEGLKILGFEDCAMSLVLPHLMLPKLKSLEIIGACHTAEAQHAILSLLYRHGPYIEALELNVWTEYLCEVDDPLADIDPMPKVKRLTIRAPPLSVPWEHFARYFPSLEELTFLYDQDFALNSMEVLEAEYEESDMDTPEMLERHALWRYRDAVVFARDLHARGFRRLARQCPSLRTIRLTVADNSFGYDLTPAEERLTLCWRRETSSSRQSFRRDREINNAARAALEETSARVPEAAGRSLAGGPARALDARSESDGDEQDADAERQVSKEEAQAAGAGVMLQVIRFFDDPSIEAEFGLRTP